MGHWSPVTSYTIPEVKPGYENGRVGQDHPPDGQGANCGIAEPSLPLWPVHPDEPNGDSARLAETLLPLPEYWSRFLCPARDVTEIAHTRTNDNGKSKARALNLE